ncbi:MAG TPA: biotin--[acetyl-CoA-carboxylase] ligase [Gemmatimonadales bacterium]|nr:biotin--[acetyl-CoA-carboxylase] ligase [Gemmatimonadales bacterium]
MSAIQWHASVPSTQDEAHWLASAGAAHGSTVAARVQTAGRGTRGRAWVSGSGGLWLSVVCRPENGSAVEVVAVRTGLVLAEFLDRIIRPAARITLKWPNDLLLGQAKLGGILAEARWLGGALSWIVVGVGINVRNELPGETVPVAARLLDIGVVLSAAELAEPVARLVSAGARTAEPLTPNELAAFAQRDWLRGRTLATPESGLADGISAGGLLRVRKGDGSVREVFGSVTLAGARG